MQTVASIYNPDQLTREELVDRFVVRIKTFQRLFKEIKDSNMESAEQHFLIEAQRGMGKTSMLLRLAYEVERTPELNAWLVPVRFNEEQYSISRLYKLWERIAINLEDADRNFIGLFDEMDSLYTKLNDVEKYERAIFDLLIQHLHDNNKKLILFIDNFGDMFKKFNKTETQRLRGVLMTCPDIRIIAASSKIAESFFDYKEPLYEFFKIERLKGLNQKEAEELLLKLGETFPNNPVKEIIRTQPQRVEILRRFTGGIIRTMILLFEVFLDNKNGNAFSDLEKIIDLVTPLYQHRMDKLSNQHQEIVHVIAIEWDAISTKKIAAKTRLESKKVSAQLKQLVDNDIIEKIPTSTKNHLYAIKERFFNIWYLMRNGRKNDRQKVKWLVRFLEIWCDGETLKKRVEKHMNYLKSGDYNIRGAFYLTEALAGVQGIDRDLQHQLLETGRSFLVGKRNSLSESLSLSDKKLTDNALDFYNNGRYDEMINNLLIVQHKTNDTYFGLGSGYLEKKNYDIAIKYFLKASELHNKNALYNIALTYDKYLNNKIKAEEYYKKAIYQDNHIEAMFNLAILYKENENYTLAEKYYLKAVANNHIQAMFNLAILYKKIKKYDKVKKYYVLAHESGHSEALYNLAIFYQKEYRDYEKARQLYAKIAKIGHGRAAFNLGILEHIIFEDFNKAALYYKNALKSSDFYEGYDSYDKSFYFAVMFLMSKNEYNFLDLLFENEKLRKEKLKERFKPIYYALMYFMQDKYPNEYLKMGAELKETIREIINEIELMRTKPIPFKIVEK